MTRISALRLYRADLPLAARLEHASASEPVLEEVFLQVRTVAGIDGLAEIRGNGSYATGAGTGAVLREIVDEIAPAILGTGLREARRRIAAAGTTPLTRALADSAVLDATAREAGRPLWQLLGGRRADAIPTHAQIGFCSLADAIGRARLAAEQGFGRIKIRVGRPKPQDDIMVVRGVRDAVGAQIDLALDANGGWDARTATQTIRALEAQRIAWIEQPTAPGNDDALRLVRRSVNVPVIADEAIRTALDLRRLSAAGAIDGVHLKLEKAGTAAALAALAAEARAASLLVFIGQMDQGRLGSSVTCHLAASIEADAYELWGFQNVTRDVTSGLDMHQGRIPLPSGAGTGVRVDMSGLTLVREIA
jgi:L-Ala-D/L-Glu epimerase / N-acetyl-D-glutamate racemase